MLKYLVLLLFTLSAVTSYQSRLPYSRNEIPTAASSSQVKFAMEQNYDDTGPGSKKPEFAYTTYKNLEDALIAYLDDPDTKLPEHERAKAIKKIIQSQPYQKAGYYKPLNLSPPKYQLPPQKYLPQDSLIHFGNNPYYRTHGQTSSKFSFLPIPRDNLKIEKQPEPFKFQKLHAVKGSPISLAHYTRDPDLRSPFDEFNPFPQYSYAYGVQDKSTGDLKHAAESRSGGTVRGFYSFIDANGKQHTVHYTADDAKGFRASVGKYPIAK